MSTTHDTWISARITTERACASNSSTPDRLAAAKDRREIRLILGTLFVVAFAVAQMGIVPAGRAAIAGGAAGKVGER